MTAPPPAEPEFYQRAGLVAGPIVAVLIAGAFSPLALGLGPSDLTHQAVLVGAIGLLMAIWWATEAIPVPATALIPLVAFPFVGIEVPDAAGVGDARILGLRDFAAEYARPVIFLFFGGFIMAIAIERSGLHRRLALAVFQIVGANSRALVGGFMLAAALVSMWISNTSTTLMLLPVAVSVVTVISETMPELELRQRSHFAIALLLGLAYGSTLGGLATLVGTPPNAFMVGYMAENHGVDISVARWMLVGLPVSMTLLPLAWLMLTRVAFPVSFRASPEAMRHIASVRAGLGPVSKAEVRTGLLFLALVLAWLTRDALNAVPPFSGLTDAGIAVTAAVAAFVIPSGQGGKALLSWEDASRLPWGILLLFGGGLALAVAVTNSGLAAWIGAQLSGLNAFHVAVLVLAATALVIFMTELTSNLATTATFLPVVAAIAIEAGRDPLTLVIPVTLAASCAFMLPVATPPNAIVFSSGHVSIPAMARAGLALNIISVVLLSFVALTLAPAVF